MAAPQMYAGLQKPTNRGNAFVGRMKYATRRSRMPTFWLNKPWCNEASYTDECASIDWTVENCEKVFSEVDPDICVYGHGGRRGMCDVSGGTCFDVVGVANDDVLNVREKPTPKSRVAGSLPWNAKAVQVRYVDLDAKFNLPKKGWIPISWCSSGPTYGSCEGKLLYGFVNVRYLAKRYVCNVPVKWVRTPR